MKTKTRICPTCLFLVCAACHGHRFPPDEALIAASDKKHGEKKQPCACERKRKTRRYNDKTI